MRRRLLELHNAVLRQLAVAGLALLIGIGGAAAQSGDAHPADQKGKPAQNAAEAAKENNQHKPDDFTEAAQAINGPAGNPECVWLGRRVVSLLWRDDLDTAFRHLDLYDRFSCPSGHIQATFRCLVRQGNIDPKAQESLNGRIHSCWINPALPPAAATAAQAPASQPGTDKQ